MWPPHSIHGSGRASSRFGLLTAGLLAVFSVMQVPGSRAHQLASRPAEEWIEMLDAPERVQRLKIDELVTALRLEPGEKVADLGAGTGVFSLPMAARVGPSGVVYAVEVQQALVDHIARKAAAAQAANVRPWLGRYTDPALPSADIDVAFMHDVLHHVEERFAYLKQTVRYLAPDARFAFVEFHPGEGPHRQDARLEVSRRQLDGWMRELGFSGSRDIDLFSDRYFVIYARNPQNPGP